jgi:hypothetical protein
MKDGAKPEADRGESKSPADSPVQMAAALIKGAIVLIALLIVVYVISRM